MSALPSNLKYETRVEGSQARSFTSQIQPMNGGSNYGPGDTVTINIPTRNNMVLVGPESYLKFTTEITNGDDLTPNEYIRLDSGGAHHFIERIRIMHGSNVISDIESYGLLAKMMFDLQLSTPATHGKHSVISGTRADQLQGIGNSVLQTNSGYRYCKKENTNNGNYSLDKFQANEVCEQTFCISLLSIVGSMANDKYLPLFALTSSSLKVEIILASSPSKVLISKLPIKTFNLKNVSYVGSMIELSDSAMSTIMNNSNGPLQFVFSDYKTFTSGSNGEIDDSSSMQFTIPIGAKFSSLKSIFFMMQSTAKRYGLTYYPASTNKFKLSEYYWRIGSATIPSKSPNCPQEFFSELLKAVGSFGSIDHSPSIDSYSYNQDYPQIDNETDLSIGTGQSGSHYIGLDLENYSGSNDRGSVFAGWNSNTDDITLNLSFPPQDTGETHRLSFTSFVLYDSVFVAENGTGYCKF